MAKFATRSGSPLRHGAQRGTPGPQVKTVPSAQNGNSVCAAFDGYAVRVSCDLDGAAARTNYLTLWHDNWADFRQAVRADPTVLDSEAWLILGHGLRAQVLRQVIDADGNRVWTVLEHSADGWRSTSSRLIFTRQEIEAFISGVLAGELALA